MKVPIILIAFLSLLANVFPQSKQLEDLCQTFQLSGDHDTTTFVVFGSKEDLKIKKPLFLFRQGSQPMPIIHQYGEKYYMPVSPFHFRDYKDQYHFVMISKPGVKLVADLAGNVTNKTYRGDIVANEWMEWLKTARD